MTIYSKIVEDMHTFFRLCDLFGVNSEHVYQISIDPKRADTHGTFVEAETLRVLSAEFERPTVSINNCEERPIRNDQIPILIEMGIL